MTLYTGDENTSGVTKYTPASELQPAAAHRLEARPHEFKISNPIITCEVKKDQDKSFPGRPGHPNWVYTFSPYSDVKIRLQTRDEAQAALLEQLTQVLAVYADATGHTIHLDQLGTNEWPYLPLSVSWKLDSTNKRIVTGFSAIDLKPEFPLWGQTGPYYGNFIRAAQQGEAVIDEKLGLPRIKWPNRKECLEIVNTIERLPEKTIPDAKDNPDWSIALGGQTPVSEQPTEQTAHDFIRGNEQSATENKPAGKAPDWVANPSFWGSAHNILQSMGFEQRNHDDMVHAAFGVQSLNDYRGTETLPEALRKVKAYANLILEPKDIPAETQNATSANSVPQNGHSSSAGNTTPESVEKRATTKSEPQNVPANSGGQKPQKSDFKLVGPAASITTLTGVPLSRLRAEMDKRYDSKAYKEIKLDGGRKGTDIMQSYVRDRFEDVFGPHGLGWKFEAHPTIGGVRCEQVDVDGGVKYQVTLVAHIFKYRVVMPDGSMEWMELSPFSDCGNNRKESYAHRAAFTALLKQVLRSFGGFNHLKSA